MSWTINSNSPDKSDKYEWKAGENDEDQIMTDTVAPGDLNLRPEDIDLAPTLAPATIGIHSGVWEWSYQNSPDDQWYIRGSIVED